MKKLNIELDLKKELIEEYKRHLEISNDMFAKDIMLEIFLEDKKYQKLRDIVCEKYFNELINNKSYKI